MAPLHRVYFLGNVMQDPEVWDAPNGTAVARWGLAVPTRLRQGATAHDDVCCIEVMAFGRQAETVKASLRKGRTVLIEGRVQWWRAAQEGPIPPHARRSSPSASGVCPAPGRRPVPLACGVPCAAHAWRGTRLRPMPCPCKAVKRAVAGCGVQQEGGRVGWNATAHDALTPRGRAG